MIRYFFDDGDDDDDDDDDDSDDADDEVDGVENIDIEVCGEQQYISCYCVREGS